MTNITAKQQQIVQTNCFLAACETVGHLDLARKIIVDNSNVNVLVNDQYPQPITTDFTD